MTGFLLAGRFATLGGTADRSAYRAAGLVEGFGAGLLGAVVGDGASPSLGWAAQSFVLMAALAALLAAGTLGHASPAARPARG